MATHPNAVSPRQPRRGFAIASLLLGLLSLPTLGLLGIGAIAGIVLGVVALVKASREPELYGGKGLAIAGVALSALSFVLIPIIGIIAAIAIPSLLRARVSANEATTLGDLRSVVSAEAAYQSSNGGYYGTLECLAAPATCIPAYPGNAPAFLDAELARAVEKAGYRRSFHPGPTASGTGPSGVSYSGLAGWAYVAVPIQWNRTGTRAFCADASGRLAYTTRGEEIGAPDGLCPASWTPLQ